MTKRHHIDSDRPGARYEYRVWGRHQQARQRLERIGSKRSDERIKDCYLLVGDSSWNAKVRDNRLKVKHLISEDRGFARWTADRPRSADDAPFPFDELFERLRLDRPQRGKSFDLYEAVNRLDPDGDTRAVFVVKHRRRYAVGGLRAESSDITVVGTSTHVHTLAIEGDDLDDLVVLRMRLGLRDEPNIAVHEAIDLALAG